MGRRKKGDKVHGWINLNKPLGMTSTQAVGKIRRLYNAQKAGHAGTLDPLATGILPIALGEATKTIPFIQDALKTYEFEITWGEQRNTDDAEGEIIATSDHRPAPGDITAILPAFTGEISQIPPQFSAIKIDGQRAYDLARDGQEVEIKAREVYVESLELLSCHPEQREGSQEQPKEEKGDSSAASQLQNDKKVEKSSFTCLCGKGTYIRSLARDIAEELGTKGYISKLHRASVGPFNDKDAFLLDKCGQISDIAPAFEDLLPVSAALDDIPALGITEKEAAKLRNGGFLSFVSKPDFKRLQDIQIDPKEYSLALALNECTPVAIVEIKGPDIKPTKVFNL